MIIKRLSDLKPGEKAEIFKIDDKSIIRKRLMELGIREGKEVIMRRDAPMGDPIEVFIMGYNLSLRKSAAKYVLIHNIQLLNKDTKNETN